jgi:DNA/RNA endonuclease G (NUC1)/V8-like Glu-specific endopeptidase
MPATPNDLLCFNGINGATGDYLQQPMTSADLVRVALGEVVDPKHLQELKARRERAREPTYAAVEGIDTTRLEQAGWGVVFAADSPPSLREALKELLDHRRAQAAKINEKFYQEFIGPRAYRPGESKQEFLARLGVGPGPADPEKGVPYYLLLVGDPQSIPFRVQYQLDVQYAVGRLWFDTLEEYRRYAHTVVAAETGQVLLPRRAVFFGVSNSDDRPTRLSAAELVTPLTQTLAMVARGQLQWEIRTAIGDGQATKAQLVRLLGGDDTPALLFTASHGMAFPPGDPRQLPHQGALLCQDWPGPLAWRKPIPTDYYFSADDLGESTRLAGLIAFHFACYGAGTPARNDFAHIKELPDYSTPQPLVARLPRRLLAHPNGSALAVVGHVDRAWGYSFEWPGAGRQLQCFESALKHLMAGKPIGSAMENFNIRYAELASDLNTELEDVRNGKTPDDEALSGLWTANNDSRSYVILGDPAVRLAFAASDDSAGSRPVIERIFPAPESNSPPAAPKSGDAPRLNIPIADTEKRYRDRQLFRETVSYNLGIHPVLRRNAPDRIRNRLRRLGLPPAHIEALLGAESFATISAGGEPSATPDALLERIIGKNDLVGAEFLDTGARAARAVGRIRIRGAGGRAIGFGTGSLIAPRLLLTNHHVLDSFERAAASTIEFNVQDGPDGNPLTPDVFVLDPRDFFITDSALDFTVVAVGPQTAGNSGLDTFGFNRARADDDPILIEEYVNIVQHPNGQPKQLALRDNQVVDLLPEFLHYRADTQPGSSGAPVFNDQWEVVALHHSGVPNRDGQGNILARGGGVWNVDMGEDQVDWIANEGVRLSRILQQVRDHPMSGDTQRELQDGLFNAPAPVPAKPSESTTVTVPAGVPAALPGPVAADGSFTLTIPVHITFRLGTAGGVGVVAGASPPSPALGSEAVSIDPNYDSREGYDPEFLGSGALFVPMPRLSAAQKADAARIRGNGDDPFELKYHHYSVVLNRKRRLAFFTAVNIDGRTPRKIQRDPDKWFFDPRVDADFQVGNDLYKGSEFDRGHLVRRLDPAWGRTVGIAKVANDDTFHFTNCSPQHKRFNEGKNLWAGLEDYLLGKAAGERKRMVVFTGPVLARDDPTFRDLPIPRQFWKVAVVARPNGKLAALGFVVSQAGLIAPVVEEAAIDVARTFQVPLSAIEDLTGVSFSQLSRRDAGGVDHFGLETSTAMPLESFDEIRLPTGTDGIGGEPVTFDVATSVPAAPADGYYLLAYDAEGNERTDGASGAVSEQVLAAAAGPVTDVVVFSHGWLNDVPAARQAYMEWVSVMKEQAADLARARQSRPRFRPVLVGLHWPSQPWGDERLAENVSFAPDDAEVVGRLVESFARRLGDGQGIRDPLREVIESSLGAGEPKKLPRALADAYRRLDQALGLKSLGIAAAPGADREEFNPEAVYQGASDEGAVSYGLISRDTLLAPLRALSFWKMKDRARQIGEGAVHQLLGRLQEATRGRDVRLHLLGHSFGCIVASAAAAGPPDRPGPASPIDSLVLLQGALSLWAYSADIPYAQGRPGYFYRLLAGGRLRGPVVTTQSRYDKAVGVWYPRGAGVARQVSFASEEFPKYGGIGSFGIQGLGLTVAAQPMQPVSGTYSFQPGSVYNLESSAYIRKSLSLFAGAHSDICHPEVAHAIWSAWTAGR